MTNIVNKPEHFEELKLTVCVVTYNQEQYVSNCLSSIVNQKVDCPFNIIVSDDGSTDGTQKIIREFAKEYPDLIVPIVGASNVGPFGNYKKVHKLAQGKYVSHMDGDDYMLPGKLQQQINLLESNKEISMVAHRMLLSRNEKIVGRTKILPDVIDLQGLILSHPGFLNSSIMYRRSYASELFSISEDFIDFYTYVYLAKKGAIAFLNKDLGVYRMSIGISSSLNLMPKIQQAIDLAASSIRDKKVISKARYRQYRSYALASLYADRNDGTKAFCEGMHVNSDGASDRALPIAIRLSPKLIRLCYSIYKRIRI
jgi:glycosyltransferase involved in cell wall biosynthesis